MKNNQYRMSFSTGGLFHQESVQMASLFLECGDWNHVREEALSENLLQARTISSAKRTCREILFRLQKLSPAELDLLVHGATQEQACILWIAVCRHYTFIGEFAREVIRERYISLKSDLQYEDFDSFFNRKADWHPELDTMRKSTIGKLRQVAFRMLREAGILSNGNTINTIMLSDRLLESLSKDNRSDVHFFPVFDYDVKGL